jgi:hypothetical protein
VLQPAGDQIVDVQVVWLLTKLQVCAVEVFTTVPTVHVWVHPLDVVGQPGDVLSHQRRLRLIWV